LATRLQLTEYATGGSASIDHLATSLGVERDAAAQLLGRCSERLRLTLSMADSPLTIVGDEVRAAGVAGLVEVSPGFDLEVSPKFLGTEVAGWREDFFVFAVLSRYGAILERDVVSGGFGSPNDLATLISRTALRLYDHNRRYPIRSYRNRRWRAFEADGELDEEDLVVPASDGFLQSASALTRENVHTTVMGRAFDTLAREVRDPGTRERVRRVGKSFPRQRSLGRVPPSVPARHRRWQQLFDLSRFVLRGARLDYSQTNVPALGYAIKTADAWQDFVSLALESSLGSAQVRRTTPYTLGARATQEVTTTPDLTVLFGTATALVDAKYKGRAWAPAQHVAAADLYEAFAFSRASSIDHVILVYPRPFQATQLATVSVTAFDEVLVETSIITAVDVECRGLSKPRGFGTFANTLVAGLAAIA
jgi:5-methylcytosine-specific restriction enzyme subunit McrC